MAFQDFDLISERRKQERQRKVKKRIAITVGVVLVLALIVGGAVCAVLYKDRLFPSTKQANADSHPPPPPKPKAKPKSPPPPPAAEKDEKSSPEKPDGDEKAPPAIATSGKAVKSVCATTDYTKTCEDSLGKAVKSNESLALTPNGFLKAAMGAVAEGIDAAVKAGNGLKFNDPKVKQAFDVCLTLMEDAKGELNQSMEITAAAHSDHAENATTAELNNWLSAVMSYQQTCIDGFPDGEAKNTMQKAMTGVKELTSNSLALANLAQLPSLLGVSIKRKLLHNDIDDEGLPKWMSAENRRVLKASTSHLVPNVTVAKDGSGNYTTINEALTKLAALPKYEGRYVIYVKEGVYAENVIVTKKMPNVTIYGDGSQKSIITGNKNFVDGTPTYLTATFAAIGEGFMAQSIGFKNTAGPEKHQAVALRVQSDRSIFVNCRMEGFQDTLYVQTHRQFYRSCYITGTVDFIFGDASAVLQNCLIYARKPMENQQNIVTAQGRVDKRETTGIVLHSCKVLADPTLEPEKAKFKSYLGRPWKEFSRTVIMETEIGDFISPEGYMPWAGDFALNTLYYAEYGNKGPGAQTSGRVKWTGYKGVISKDEAMKYTVAPFIQGDQWLNSVEGVPVRLGLFS